MDSCQFDSVGRVICNVCAVAYLVEANSRSLFVMPGSGGCELVCKCSTCGAECCAKRNKPSLKPESEQKTKNKRSMPR